jgi:hypothetical protein
MPINTFIYGAIMKKLLTIQLAIIVLICCCSLTFAENFSNTNYTVKRYVKSMSGKLSSSENYNAKSTSGQDADGSMSYGQYTAKAGYWANANNRNITLSVSTVAENNVSGLSIATIKISGLEAAESLTYSLVSGEGDTDNAIFSISGSELIANAVFDYETKNSYSIRIRATDSYHGWLENIIIIRINDTPVLSPSTIMVQPINEDEFNSFTMTVTDFETAECSMSVSFTSSNESLISSNSITYTCSSDIYTFSMTPVSNQYGSSVISVTMTDADGLASSRSFLYTVVSVNDPPVIGYIDKQYIAKNAAFYSISLSANDVETATCSLDLTFSSSNTSILPVENISYTCGAGGYYLSFTPLIDQTGETTISLTLTDSGGLAASQSFIIEIFTPPTLSTISDQNTSASTISFTVVDAQGGDITIAAKSSDQSILPYTGINLCGSNSNVIVQSLIAGVPKNLSLTFSPYANQHDRITITVIATESSAVTSSTDFSVIVSPPGSGNALEFNDDADYVSFGSISGSHPLGLYNTNFTISFWCKPTVNNVHQEIIDKSDGTTTHYSIYIHDDGIVRMMVNDVVQYESKNAVAANKWQHITIISNMTSYTGYFNGDLVDNLTTNSLEYVPDSSANVLLARSTKISNSIYRGRLDELCIWDRSLSIEEIRQNMCQTLSGNEQGLIAYYRFDSIQGSTTLLDLSGNNYDGTLINMQDDDWVSSGAPIGYLSVYDYVGTNPGDFSVTLSHSNSDQLTAIGDGGSYTGIQLYLVNEAPNETTSPSYGWSSIDTSHYWGVYPIGNTTTYAFTYSYSGNSYVSTEANLSIAGRTNNASSWYPTNAELNIEVNTLSQSGLFSQSGLEVKEIVIGNLNTKPFAGSGNAIHFDGVNDYISIQTTSALRPAQISIEAWIKADTWKTNVYEGTIVGADKTVLSSAYGYVLRCGNNGSLDFTIGGQSAWFYATTSSIMSLNTWHHVAATFDGTTLKVYIDGIERASESPTNASLNYVGDETLIIGESLGFPGRYFHGTMDEIRIWNVVRSQADIQSTRYQILTGKESGLVGYWRFDQDSVRTVYDITHNLNHGTFTNMDVSNWVDSSFSYSITTNEDVSFTMLAGYDLDGDSITLSTVSAPSNGSLIFDNANVVITYTPTENYYGSDQFTYQLTDGSNSDSFTVLVNVSSVNDYPSFSDISDQTTFDNVAIYSIPITVNDIETEGCSLGITFTSSNNSLISSDNISYTCESGTFYISLTPVTDQVGNSVISVTIKDGGNLTATTSFALTVIASNNPPVLAVINDQVTNEDSAIHSMKLTSTDNETAICSLGITYSSSNTNLIAVNNISYTCDTDGFYFSFTPTTDLYGSTRISISITDAGSLTATSSFDLTVISVNDTPTVANTIPDQSLDEDASFDFSFHTNTFNDVDAGDSLTYTATLEDGNPLSAWLSFDPSTRNFTGIPTNEYVGTISIKVTATDTSSASVSDVFALTINNTNDTPTVANEIPDQTTNEDAVYNFTFNANTFADVDSGDFLSYTATLENDSALPTWLSFEPITRNFTGTPTNEYVGTISIKVTATDTSLASVSDVFALTINNTNDTPTVANEIPDQTVNEDAAYNFTFNANTFADVDSGDFLSYTAALENDSALPTWLSFESSTRHFTGTPTNEYVGTISIKVTATDTSSASVSDVFALTINNTNDTPTVANEILDQTTNEDVVFNFTFNANTFADVDSGDFLSYTATLENDSALPTWLSFEPTTRHFTGTPTNEYVGTISIKVTATDTSLASVSDVFALTVNNTNDTPTVANEIPDQTTNEDAVFNFTFNANTFTDVDSGDFLSYTATLENDSALPTWLSFEPTTRHFTGTPTNEYVGTISIKVTATDTSLASVSDVFALTINNTNDTPTVANEIPDQTTNEDAVFNFTFNANTFADVDSGDFLSYTATLENDSALSTWLSFEPSSRNFTGTPTNEYVGTISIKVTATDTSSASVSDVFALTVNNTNDTPTVANEIPDQTVNEDAAYNFTFNANTSETLAEDVSVAVTLIEIVPTYSLVGVPVKFLDDGSKLNHVDKALSFSSVAVYDRKSPESTSAKVFALKVKLKTASSLVV